MPTYVYVIVKPDGTDGEPFEVVQRMSDEPLTKHPETGEPVRRVPTAPNLSLQWSGGANASKLSDKNLERLGFTKYQNAGGGKFEKRAGAGPDAIRAD
jgi:predicted nucleic acid-binding Zn ribbon protein